MPAKTNSTWRLDNLPTSSVISSRSSVTICEALAMESLGRPVALAASSTLPGASAQRRLLVKGTQTTERMRLRFSASPWTTNTGLRKPGPEPVGFGRSAQYTWPWAITIRWLRACGLPPSQGLGRVACLRSRTRGSSLRSQLQDRGARCIQLPPRCRPDYGISSVVGTAVPRR